MLKHRLRGLLAKSNIGGRDVIVFLMSLLLAVSIWLLHNLSLNYSSTMSVPVIAVCNIDGHAGVSSNSSVIAARCRTSGFSLLKNRRRATRPAVQIRFATSDMRHKEGDIFFITSSELASYVSEIFGEGVSLEAFLSDNVQFRFPFENNRKVPVHPMKIVSFKEQYMAVGEMRLSPDSVIIYGEPFVLENIDRVFTKTIELENLHSSAHGVVRIEEINGVRMSDTEVKYSLDVSRYVEISSEAVISLRNVPAGRHVSVYPSVARVVYKCAFPVSNDPSADVHFYIDYKDFIKSKEGKCVPVSTPLPEGVISYTIEPEVFDCIEEGRQ